MSFLARLDDLLGKPTLFIFYEEIYFIFWSCYDSCGGIWFWSVSAKIVYSTLNYKNEFCWGYFLSLLDCLLNPLTKPVLFKSGELNGATNIFYLFFNILYCHITEVKIMIYWGKLIF